MTTPLKWLIIFLLGAFFVLFVGYRATMQNMDVRTTSEVELLAENMRLGLIRSEIKQSNDGYPYIDKEEIVANLVSHVTEAQKNHGYNIDLQYVFLDKNGYVTENEAEIRGIQFAVRYIGKDGKVKASAEKRLEFDALDS